MAIKKRPSLTPKLKEILDSLDELIFILDQTGAVEWVNLKTLNALGLQQCDQIVGEPVQHFLALITQGLLNEKRPYSRSDIDHVTGLPNVKYLRNALRQSLKQAATTDNRLALLYLDIDQFKLINQQVGHTGGDEVLWHISQFIQEMVHQTDLVIRMEDDEFIIVVPSVTSADDIHQLAEHIQNHFETLEIHIDDNRYHITMSIGCSIYPDDTNDLDKLIKLAKAAMKMTKKLK